jgi:hypothetical protein
LNFFFCQINTCDYIVHVGLHNILCVRAKILTQLYGLGESNYLMMPYEALATTSLEAVAKPLGSIL